MKYNELPEIRRLMKVETLETNNIILDEVLYELKTKSSNRIVKSYYGVIYLPQYLQNLQDLQKLYIEGDICE